MRSPSQYPVLLVEDNLDDVILTRQAARRGNLPISVHDVRNAEEAIRYLKGASHYSDREQYPFPRLVISDLKMPGMSGTDLLQWIRQHPEWNDLPIVVLSSLKVPQELARVRALAPDAFFPKAANLTALVANLQQMMLLLSQSGE